MVQAPNPSDITDRFIQFYRKYYRDEIGTLAQKYPNEQRSLYIDHDDLYKFDAELAEEYRNKPDQHQEYAEEALRLYDLPADVKLGRAHVRLTNLPETVDIRDIRVHDDHIGRIIEVQGIVRKATDVRPKITEAAFECQRCGTMTYIPQSDSGFQEPHECQGCERQGPFHVDFDQSEFVDAQKVRVQESPEGLRGGETPQNIDVDLEDDITGRVTAGDHVTVTGVLHIEQQTSGNEKTPIFDLYMDGVAVEIEDEEFEDMNITEADVAEIVDLSNEPDIHQKMVDSVAPSIYGYEEEKLAMILQLFSGVTKHLPDGSRIRGDLHMLLIGDPGTGKSAMLQYIRNIAPRSVYTSGKGSSSAGLCVTGDTRIHTTEGFVPIRELATNEHPDPVSAETAAAYKRDLFTFDRDSGTVTTAASSRVWRMPKKPCRRIETERGKALEASVNTPVLTCGTDGIEWKSIRDVEAGDYVAAPKYDDVERSAVPVDEFIDYTEEKLRLEDESIEFLREQLIEKYGTLRDAATALEFSEDFIYDSLSNRFVPIEKLDQILDAIGATRDDVTVRRAMLAHGDDVRIPQQFDEDLLYLVGLVFGDGDIALDRRDGNRGLVRISNSDEALLERAVEIIEATFDKRVEIERQEDRVPCLRLHSGTIARLFSNLGMESPKDKLELDPRLTTAKHADAFLRGLMDADGSVSSRTDGGSSIQFSTISEPLAEQVQLILETYGIESRRRARDRRGTNTLSSGYTIESKRVQHHLAVYGRDIDRYADVIGFESTKKRAVLSDIVAATDRRDEKIPIGSALATAEIGGSGGSYYLNFSRGDNPGRGRARKILNSFDLGDAQPAVEEAINAGLTWEEVVAAVDTGDKEVYDLTVPGTNNFLGNGLVTHNTAAAVRDDFGEGQQWTLEAGALVLADKGIAAVDELDKMRCVSGETLVRLGDGSRTRIGDLASDAAVEGDIEELPNGRTIRDVDLDVWTMTDDERIVRRPVTAVHEYDAPETLLRVSLTDGTELTATEDHPFFVFEDGERVERPAAALGAGDEVYVPADQRSVSTDGGVRPASSIVSDEMPASSVEREPSERRVSTRTIDSIQRVESGTDTHVYDLTVQGTHNFVANGMIVHNSEDRSAMHEALEQQSISVSKAGINATLKSRCSLLGAANPKYGRFDQYEPIGEQIDLEPALISRFDLIFTVTDDPDPESDAKLAEHIINTNYAGELHTQKTKVPTSEFSDEEIDSATEDVTPEIDAELLRKYIAYAKRNCYPTMTEEAKEVIRQFYVDFRAKGADEDAPVPVTARKLEALVRLSEASARLRLSDTVEREDAVRVTDIVESCLRDIGMDPETGEFDADIVETGTSKNQRDRIKDLKGLIQDLEDEYEEGAPIGEVIDRATTDLGLDEAKAESEVENLRRKGEVYEPRTDYLRTT